MTAPTTIEGALISVLKADSGIIAAIAPLADGSAAVLVHGGQVAVPYPYIALERISTPGAADLTGHRHLEWPRMQIDCWAKTALAAATAAAAVRAAIEGQTKTVGAITFTATFQDQRGPAPDPETLNFRASLDFYLWHQRS